MGICASSKRVRQEERDSDENVVYVMDEQGGGGEGEDGRGARTAASRKVASLFSQKGKKGPNQDAVILCQVRARTTTPPAAALPEEFSRCLSFFFFFFSPISVCLFILLHSAGRCRSVLIQILFGTPPTVLHCSV
jgi:hypothetical protein